MLVGIEVLMAVVVKISRLLGYDTVQSVCRLLHAGCLLGLLFSMEDGGDMCFQNVIWLSVDYIALYPRGQNSNLCPFCMGVELWLSRWWKNIVRMLENRESRWVFGSNRDEVTGWGKLQNEELHNLYFPNITVIKSRKMRWVGHVALRNAGSVFIGMTEGRRQFGKPRLRLENNIKIDLKTIEGESLRWIYKA